MSNILNQQPKDQQSSGQNKSKLILMVIVIFIFFTLIVSGGIYIWQQKNLDRVNNEMKLQNKESQDKIEEQEKQINELQKQREEQEKQINELQKQIEELTKVPDRFIEIISPNGGESFCFGEDVLIEWKNDLVEAIEINLSRIEGSGGMSIPIGSFPSNFNSDDKAKGSYVWSIPQDDGRVIEFYAYKISILSSDGIKPQASDRSDNVFSILECKQDIDN